MLRDVIAVCFALCALVTPTAPAQTTRAYETVKLDDRTTVQYALILPPNMDEDAEHPVLIAMAGGAMNDVMVEAGLAGYWEAEAKARGWVVVAPLSPEDGAVFRWNIKPLMDAVAKRVKVEGNKFHVAGISNGGIAAFDIAIKEPDRVASLTTLPGHPATAAEFARLARIKNIPVTMYVGETDVRWHDEGEKVEERLKKLGGKVTFEIVKGEGHVIRIPPKQLFDLFESHRPKPPPMPTPESTEELEEKSDIAKSLDDFHDAASKADFDRYFSHFGEDAIFLGTDATERWTVEEFKKYCEPNFRIGKGWTYTPRERHVTLSPKGDMAWFDELLDNDKYGLCRGSGVLVKVTEPGKPAHGAVPGESAGKPQAKVTWKLLQYNLTFMVPNDTAESVVRTTKPKQPKPEAKLEPKPAAKPQPAPPK